MLTTLPSDEIRAAASAIANARGARKGVPEIANILELLPIHVAHEVLEDATAALEAVEALRRQKRQTLTLLKRTEPPITEPGR